MITEKGCSIIYTLTVALMLTSLVLVTLEAALGEAVPWIVDHCEGTIMSSGTQPGSSEDPGACALLTARENIVTILVDFCVQYLRGHTMQNRQYLFSPIVCYRSHS